ncbi:MAG TPA: AMP-binding protein [Acidimicrobiales bacterium]
MWNIADLFEEIAARIPDEPAVIDRGHLLTWAGFVERGEALAADLVGRGVSEGGRVGVGLHNSAEYLISYLACFQSRCVPFNINYRYNAREVRYLVDDAGAEALIVDDDYVPVVLEATSMDRGRRPIVYGLDHGCLPAGVISLGDALRGGSRVEASRGTRQPEDEMFLYTGGTTGMPKAVVWQQSTLVELLAGAVTAESAAAKEDPSAIVEQVATRTRLRSLPAAPLMHATGLLSQFANLMAGGCTILAGGRSFVASSFLQAAAEDRANILVFVGDAFGRPIVEELDRRPGRYDLSALQGITSSGAMWSRPVKEALLRHLPQIRLYDAYGASEGSGLGVSLAAPGEALQTASFVPGPRTVILDEDNRLITPRPGVVGRIAIRPPIPLRYHGDPERSARVFPTIEGQRYSVPGDYIRVGDSGAIELLGRGASCINSGGEKIYPEEIEEVLKEHPAVNDVGCVGIPDLRFGQAVCVIVEPVPGQSPSDSELIAFVKARVARYKAPRSVIRVASLERLPNGKVDRRHLAEVAGQGPSS